MPGPRLRLIVGGLRWRAGPSLSMFLVAVVAVTAASFGPLYLTAADHSVLLSSLRQADVGTTGLTLLPRSAPGAGDRLAQAVARSTDAFGAAGHFGPAILTEDVGASTTSHTTGQGYGTDLVARTGVCRSLVFVAGRCPTGPGTVAVSTRSARALGVRTGSRLTLALNRSPRSATLTVSGLFRPGHPAAAVWWGANYFAYGFGTPQEPALDDVFASAATVQASAPADDIAVQAQEPLIPTSLTPGSVNGFTAALAAFERRAPQLFDVTASSRVGVVLAGAGSQEHSMGIIVLAVDLQLVLLCLLVLYFVAARTAETRQPDVRLADLRGFGHGDALAVVALEPLVLLGLAVPVGIAAAWAAALIAVSRLLAPGIAPSLGLPAVAAALGSFVAGVAATVLGGRLLLGRGAPS
ncbi:MAG: hypothetical protein ACRDY1_14115, partial [Acidimicrobiales bacterium]